MTNGVQIAEAVLVLVIAVILVVLLIGDDL